MKISNEKVSAFAVYSEQLKQKKKPKAYVNNKVTKNQKKSKDNNLKLSQMKEIGDILQSLIQNSNKSKPQESSKEKKIIKLNDNDKQNKITLKKRKKATNISQKVPQKKNRGHIQDESPAAIITLAESKRSEAYFKNSNELSDDPSNKQNDCQNSEVIKAPPISGKNEKKSTKNKLKDPVLKNVNNAANSFEWKIRKTISFNKPLKTQKNNTRFENSHLSNKIPLGNKRSKPKKLNKLSSEIQKKKMKPSTDKSEQLNEEDKTATYLFEWLISPIEQQDFKRIYWEKQPLLIQREGYRRYFSQLLSTKVIDEMIRNNIVYFTKHLDVTSYSDGVRETHNLSGRAQANVVWDFYSNGCSVRLLNPQVFLPKIHTLNATLQEYFGCFIGANVYLTPPNSQGFAPHYDDIEAFVLQIEGKKHWKVYPPRNDKETLPRFSSPNFSQEEIGKPCLDVILEPGDMLYFPRGFIHQASTVEGEHSLHITLSAYQKTAWVDLFEKVLPLALKKAASVDVDFRKGLPWNYLDLEFHGSDKAKVAFHSNALRLMSKLGQYLSLTLGAGVDQMGAQFMHDALPPVLTPGEKASCMVGTGLKMRENGKLEGRVELQLDTWVKLIRRNVCRLVEEEDEVRLYHCLDNPLEYQAEDAQFLVLPAEGVKVITLLSTKYPDFVQIKTIPHENDEDLLSLITDLWDSGLILTQGLEAIDDD